MKKILNKVKNKYKDLDRTIMLDGLCGNKFWKNEITVSKYLAGIAILTKMRKIVE